MKHRTIDISRSVHNSKDRKMNIHLFFDVYSLVAVYQYSIIDGKVTLFNSFEDVSILDHKEKTKSEVNEFVQKKFKIETIYPIL